MRDGRCPFEVVNGVPVVTAPEEIDITNAPELRSALLEAAAGIPPGPGCSVRTNQCVETHEPPLSGARIWVSSL